MKISPSLACTLALLLLPACAVGPKYKKPEVADLTPSEWQWKRGEPADEIPKGEWWRVFHDAVLDDLESKAVAQNQNLRAAVARVDEARAAARLTRAQFFPTLSLDPSMNRQRTTGHLPTPIPFKVPPATFDTFSAPLDLSYEIDLWGRVRRSFEAARAQAQSSISDYQNALLTLTGDVAINYFLLRSLDTELTVLRRTIELRQDSVRILSARFDAGAIPEIDLARARTELATAREDLADTTRQRVETLHALALLCGRPATAFEIAERNTEVRLPSVPPGLPSSVLERRPDIARAERAIAAKNAQIGVAEAAYFPVVRLTGQAGFLSAEAGQLFSWDSRVWSIGPSVSLPLFNGGRTAADVRQAKASYQEALAAYRQTVLTAFKEVEDSLAQIALWGNQASALEQALQSARRVAELAHARYDAGTISYLEVVDAERERLQQERQQSLLEGQRFAATVRLIKALGGGWQGSSGMAAK